VSDPNGLTWAATLVSLAVAIPTAGHAVIYKRDPRSATLWVLLIALLPLGGSLLYGLFGINRYQRRARRLFPGADPAVRQDLAPRCPEAVSAPLAGLAHLVGRATGQSLTSGNRIEPLVDGEQAYPAMLAAIESARTASRWLRTSSTAKASGRSSSMRCAGLMSAACKCGC
jgi:cardiolipin synthetase 2 (EC 2.7.8.-)